MEIAIPGNNNGCTPFQREVREWQHIDPDTGVLLTGRLQADRWTNGSKNTYGKMVDSQNLSQSNGTHHTQHKQFEVLQARTSAGSMQVIRAETVQTTSSRWSSSHSPSTLTKNSVNNLNTLIDKSDSIEYKKNNHNNILNTAPSLKLSNLMKNGSNVLTPSHALSMIERHQPFTNNAVRLLDVNRSVSATTTTTTSTNTTPFSSSSSSSTLGLQHQYQHQYKNTNSRSNLPTTAGYGSNVGGGSGVDIINDLCVTDGYRHSKKSLIESFRQTKANDNMSNKLELFQRGRSVSTDDLSTNWNQTSDGDNDEPTEWRRVSTIRRSFQFPKNSSIITKTNRSRPLDLPESSVSVSKIRDELENGRRLSTAMRNNNVDLAALDDILNSPEIKTKKKSASFLTAESLKEIRGKLKKLSDESLYKDDFITQDDLDKETIHLNVNLKDNTFTDKEQMSNNLELKSQQHTTNSLEARIKNKVLSSTEWHQRRKSYGFEKMIQQDDKAMSRLESSTDSGIGRSSEIGNCSPTESNKTRTVITFGNKTALEKPSFLRPTVQSRIYEKSIENNCELKRHSIAVDETKYVRDNLRKTSIHLNGLYPKDLTVKEHHQNIFASTDEQARRQKRVEFCKTEVHFAAESGRVNIVETDEKPPPTQNFRRRRRNLATNNTYINTLSSGLAIIHFGDEKKSINENTYSTSEDYMLTETPKSNVTVSIPITTDILNTKKPLIDDSDEQSLFQDESSIRGILKNKPIKPKPYHLGENIDSTDDLWGIKLKPIVKDDNCLPISYKNFFGEKDETLEEFKEATTRNSNSTSVTERIKIFPKEKENIGYSTKINLSHSNSPIGWETSDGDNKFYNNIKESRTLYENSTISSQSNQKMNNPMNSFETSYNKPIAAPRIKVLGSSNAISHQLSQLRRLYDKVTESDDNMKADEEVKKYFGNEEKYGNSSSSVINKNKINPNDSLEDTASELSGSWSRLRSERNLKKLQTNKNKFIQEIPNSNVMSIKLQALESTNNVSLNNDIRNEPVAKPRTLNSGVSTMESHAANEKSSLKIQKDINGARKLRDHELSYFGVKIGKPEIKNSTNSNSNRRNKRETINLQIVDKTINNGSLLNNNKPDLLQHSINTCVDIQPKYAEPEYEKMIINNIQNASTIAYNRKIDLNRDEMILDEMNSNAEQALKDINDDISRKEHNRQSFRKESIIKKPLETIKEKTSKKSNQTDRCSRDVTDLNQLQNVRSCGHGSQIKQTKLISSSESQPRSRSGSIEKIDHIKTRSSLRPKVTRRIKSNNELKGQKSSARSLTKEHPEKDRRKIDKIPQRIAKSNEKHKPTSGLEHKFSYHYNNGIRTINGRITPEYQNKSEINDDSRKSLSVSNKVKTEQQYLPFRKSQQKSQSQGTAKLNESFRSHHYSSHGHKNSETLTSAKKSSRSKFRPAR